MALAESNVLFSEVLGYLGMLVKKMFNVEKKFIWTRNIGKKLKRPC